jgi:hypothetical protein
VLPAGTKLLATASMEHDVEADFDIWFSIGALLHRSVIRAGTP